MKKQPCWVDSIGTPHLSREECQKSEIQIFVGKEKFSNDPLSGETVAEFIMRYKDGMLNILTMKDDSRPGARGVKKPRKTKAMEMPQPEKAA